VRLDRYEIVGTLGEGAMAVVYLARDRELGREVALKCLRPSVEVNERLRERFVREAQAVAKLSHPNVVTVHDVGAADGRLYMVMEKIAGGSLEKAMAGARTELPRFLRILAKAARGVGAAHRGGIVHRDLKPGNIMLAPDDEPKVVDFGLAHFADARTRLTRTGVTLGTPLYMAPEQVAGRDVSARTDVYALGAILYEMLTGSVPHDGSTPVEVYHRIVDETPRPPRAMRADVPAELEAVALKALEKEPADRYASAGEFAEDIDRYLAGEPVVARPPGTLRRLRRGLARRMNIVVPAAAVLAAVAIGAWALLRTSSREEAFRDLERGRPVLDEAAEYLYSHDADYGRLVERVKEGQRLIERAVAAAPDVAAGHYLLGRAWELRGEDIHAERAWRRAIELDPAFSPARFSLGRLLLARAVLAGSSVERQSRARRTTAALPIAREAEEHIRAATDLQDELQRDLARAILAHLQRRPDAGALAEAGVARFKGRRGEEEFHLLRGFAADTSGERVLAFDEALHLRPKHALALCFRASAVHALGRYDEAIKGFTAAIAAMPRFVEAYVSRGSVHVRNGDIDRGLEDFNTAVELTPAFAEAYAARANAHRMHGRYDLALADCRAALERRPDMAIAYFYRGQIHQGMKDAAQARRDFDRALELDPDSAEVYDNRAHLRRGEGDLDGAAADWREVIRVMPDSSRGYLNLGVALVLKGDDEGALASLGRAIEVDPKDAKARATRGALLCRVGKTAEGLGDLNKALELDPAMVEALANRANVLVMTGDVRGAMRDLDETIRLEPGRAAAHALRGKLRCREGDAAGGMADLARAIELDPRDPTAYYYRATARVEADDAGALADLDRALERDPRDARALGLRGLLLARRGRASEALADFNEAIRLDPDELESRFNRAVLRIKNGEWEGVIEDLTVVLRIKPERFESRYHRAGALYYLKRYDEAEADVKRALAEAPPDWPTRAKAESLRKLCRER